MCDHSGCGLSAFCAVGKQFINKLAVLRQKAFKNACLISPTYSEYEREISLGGGVCHYYMLTPENHFALCTEELFAFLF